jgi:opacity protein-like surface antigen
MIGIRPLSTVGAEAEYIDFGNSGAVTIPSGAFEGAATTHPKAAALLAVGYLPIPLPHLDIFGKVGAAELKTDISAAGNLFGSNCGFRSAPVCDPVSPLQYSAHGSSARLAYGAGVQVKLDHLALRAEYERISAPGSDPDLLSLGLLWEF